VTELIIFQHIVTNQVYCWNGEHPIGLLPENLREAWDPKGVLTDKELDLFKSLEGTKKKSFELKGRGKFEIVKRIKADYEQG
jgi:hypothetical protein